MKTEDEKTDRIAKNIVLGVSVILFVALTAFLCYSWANLLNIPTVYVFATFTGCYTTHKVYLWFKRIYEENEKSKL